MASDIKAANAIARDGHSISLTYVGRAPKLRQHAIPLIFHINGPAGGISVGEPVRILVQSSKPLRGIVVPINSVVRNGNGQTIVWIHESAERFVARAVTVEPLDGNGMLVTAGLGEKVRVVTNSAHILSEVR